MKFFTGCTHYFHKNIIRYCKRPFDNINEMNETMIKNYNSVIGENDEVYFLGDFAQCPINDILTVLLKLNGQKFFILGDHDKQIYLCRSYFNKISPMMKIKINNITVTLCHYSMRVWSKSHYNSWHLYSHSHGQLDPQGKSWDVGVDNNNFIPLSEIQIEKIMKNRPNNFNLINNKNKEI